MVNEAIKVQFEGTGHFRRSTGAGTIEQTLEALVGKAMDPVWSKNSCGFARIVFQEPPEPFTALNRAFALWVLADHRKEQHVALALMIPLVMIMVHVLFEPDFSVA